MSWLGDRGRDIAKFYGDYGHALTSLGGHAENPVSDFYRDEVSGKADLRGAQLVSIASGIPWVGDIVRGVEGANQLEDLYNSTGNVPEYPGLSGGSGGLGRAIADVPGVLSQKIEDGTHDLAEFYSGDRQLSQVFDDVNGKSTHTPRPIARY